MKRLYIAFALLAIVACQIEEINDPKQGTDEFRFVAERLNTNDDTKTIRQDNGSIIWDSSEAIKVFTSNGASGKFVSTNDAPASKAEFIGSFDKQITDDEIKNGIMALYPYSDDATYNDNKITFTIPSVQTAKEGSFDTGLFPSVAYSTTNSLYFHNVCAGIRFTVSQEGIKSVTFKGNDSEALAGKVSVSVIDSSVVESVIEAKTEVTVNAPEEGYFEPGKEYYIVILAPEGPTYMFLEGFSITYHKDSISDTFESHKALELHRSQFASIKEKDKGLAFIDPAQPIEFADDIMKKMCVIAFDFDGDEEVSYGEAKSATDLSEMKLTEKTFKSFDEFKYFINITAIPDSYFQDSHLVSITLPENLTSIGSNAFYECSSLKTISLPENSLPENLASIGSKAFYKCTSLTRINIPKNITTIEDETFSGCSSLVYISLPENLTSIGFNAFYECSSLKTISLPENLTSIGSDAFSRCKSLTRINIPKNIITIAMSAFSFCSSVEEITLPENLISIGSEAFYGCESLVSINLPENLTSIGLFAFKYCSSLKSINIPKNITTIKRDTFYDCSSLEEITLPENLTSIEESAFRNCSSLEEITLPENLTSIEESAFRNCSRLKTISLPENLTSIGTYVFYQCKSLKSINIPKSITTIERYTFAYCSSLVSITMPENLISIGTYAFYDCSSLEEITLPENLTSIGSHAFETCDMLVSAYLKPIVPPSLDYDVWPYEIRKIHVPMEAIEDYKNATGWAEYADKIVGYDFSTE